MSFSSEDRKTLEQVAGRLDWLLQRADELIPLAQHQSLSFTDEYAQAAITRLDQVLEANRANELICTLREVVEQHNWELVRWWLFTVPVLPPPPQLNSKTE
jgi:hypothetical protein